jgi:hypothetical protein
MIDFVEGLHENIPNEEYHRHRSMNSGSLKNLLRSPAHFVADRKSPPKSTPALNFGSATHSFLLQPELNEIAVIPTDINKRTNVGKLEFAAWEFISDDKIKVTASEWQTIHAMIDLLLSSDTAQMLFKKGLVEVSAFWKHPIFNFECRARPDFMVDDLNIIVDHKGCQDASPQEFAKTVINYGYDIQAAWYTQGLEILTGKKWDFVWIAQEKVPPYAYAFYQATPELLYRGQNLCNKASQRFSKCLKTGDYPGYLDELVLVQLPGWA